MGETEYGSDIDSLELALTAARANANSPVPCPSEYHADVRESFKYLLGYIESLQSQLSAHQEAVKKQIARFSDENTEGPVPLRIVQMSLNEILSDLEGVENE